MRGGGSYLSSRGVVQGSLKVSDSTLDRRGGEEEEKVAEVTWQAVLVYEGVASCGSPPRQPTILLLFGEEGGKRLVEREEDILQYYRRPGLRN
mmetsp:Transcript_1698/g.3849  ORF Transcript_1698/g.3849 Transcript_1698/m.3849 type:complete len:93 (-) Transcript_1698:140-418(-)